MCRSALSVLFLCAVLACAADTPGWAQEPFPRAGYGQQVQPLDRILPQIRNGRPGRFYDAEGPFPDPYGGYHYRIKWLTPDGRVIWLDADARSGRVLGVARGDWREMGPPAFGPPREGEFGGLRPAGPPPGPGPGWRGERPGGREHPH